MRRRARQARALRLPQGLRLIVHEPGFAIEHREAAPHVIERNLEAGIE